MKPIFMRRARGAGCSQDDASLEVKPVPAPLPWGIVQECRNPLLRRFTLYHKVLSMTISRAILAAAVLLGIAADALLRDGFDGIAFALWIALLAGAALMLAYRNRLRLTGEGRGWLAVAVLAAASMAWRASPQLQALDFLATLFALGAAAVVMGAPSAGLHAARLRDAVWAGARVLRDVFVGAVPLTMRELLAPSARSMAGQRGWPAARAVLIVVVLLAVFGSLLRSADPVFAS